MCPEVCRPGDLQILHKPDQGKRDAAFLTRDASQIHHNQEKMTLTCSTTSSPEPPFRERGCQGSARYTGGVLPHCQPRRVADARIFWASLVDAHFLLEEACVVLGLGPTPLMYHSCPLFSGYFHLGELGSLGRLPAENEPVG